MIHNDLTFQNILSSDTKSLIKNNSNNEHITQSNVKLIDEFKIEND